VSDLKEHVVPPRRLKIREQGVLAPLIEPSQAHEGRLRARVLGTFVSILEVELPAQTRAAVEHGLPCAPDFVTPVSRNGVMVAVETWNETEYVIANFTDRAALVCIKAEHIYAMMR